MSTVELDGIRRKVEQGEALTPREWEQLTAAAQAQPGPTLRLAVAHAMMNAGEERTALPLLEALVRDFPRDLQSWLGLARALLSTDRKAEAERALREALALSPHDPEALKALATLAMGRGEIARARQWVADVLRRDPFDSEAQLLSAELDAVEGSLGAGTGGGGEGQEYALRPEFLRALTSALRGRGAAVSIQGDALFLKTAKGDLGRADLRSMYASYLGGTQPLGPFIAAAADGLISVTRGVGGDREALLGRLRPVLRPMGFDAVARGALWKEGPAGLAIFYAIEDPQYVRYLPEGVARSNGMTVEEVDRASFEALGRSPAPLRAVQVLEARLLASVGPTGVWAVSAEDGHDAARLLTVSQREELRKVAGPGPWRVDLGRREAAIVARADDVDAVDDLEAIAPAEDGIPGKFLLHADGTLERLEPAVAR